MGGGPGTSRRKAVPASISQVQYPIRDRCCVQRNRFERPCLEPEMDSYVGRLVKRGNWCGWMCPVAIKWLGKRTAWTTSRHTCHWWSCRCSWRVRMRLWWRCCRNRQRRRWCGSGHGRICKARGHRADITSNDVVGTAFLGRSPVAATQDTSLVGTAGGGLLPGAVRTRLAEPILA